MALYQTLGESEGARRALRLLGVQAFLCGDLERADVIFAESLAMARATGDAAGEGLSLHSQGAVAWSRGAYQLATERMHTALALFRKVEARPRIATALINPGLAPFDADPNASQVNEETWILLSAMSGAALVGYTLAHLGALARAMGDLDTACARLKESVAWFRTRRHQSGLAHCLGQLGAILRARGEFGSAHALLEESLALRRQLGDRRGVGMTLNTMTSRGWHAMMSGRRCNPL